jgi:hypothetical protein
MTYLLIGFHPDGAVQILDKMWFDQADYTPCKWKIAIDNRLAHQKRPVLIPLAAFGFLGINARK